MKTEFAFGRVPSPKDARDHLLSIAVPGLADIKPQNKTWPCRTVLDQRPYMECVGFSWAHWGDCAPVEQKWGTPMGRWIYRECKKVDGHPNEEGSTLRAGAKVMLARGRIERYFWAQSVDEALRYVSTRGPVVFGTDWYEGMNKPSYLGCFIRATGKVLGGHAYLVNGVDWTHMRARIHQSWGTEWGDNGECWISIADLKKVLANGGEACAATERAMPTGGTNG